MSIHYNPRSVMGGLVVYYDSANKRSYPGVGVTFYDLSGNNINGELLNGVGYSTDKSGILTFNGTNQYISLPNSRVVPRTNDFSYRIVLRFNSTDAFDTLWELGNWTDTLLFRYEPGILNVYCESTYIHGISWTPTIGTWYDIVLQRQSNLLSFYVNGQILGAPVTFTTDIDIANPNLWLMSSQHSGIQYTNGDMSIFSVYNRGLNNIELLTNFNSIRRRYNI